MQTVVPRLEKFADVARYATQCVRSHILQLPRAANETATVDARLLDKVVKESFRRASIVTAQCRGAVDPSWWRTDGAIDQLVVTMIEDLTGHTPLPLDFNSYHGLLDKVWLCRERYVRAAVERADYDDAAVRLLASIASGNSISASLTVDVLVGITDVSIFFALIREIRPADVQFLRDLLEYPKFAASRVGSIQTLYVLWMIWSLEVLDGRELIVPRLRRLARKTWGRWPSVGGMILALARLLGDSSVDVIYNETNAPLGDGLIAECEASVRALLKVRIEEVASRLPEAAGTRAAFSSARAGQISKMSRADLALVDIEQLQDVGVTEFASRHIGWRDWTRARAAITELSRRGSASAEEYLYDLIFAALRAHAYDVVASLADQLRDDAERRAVLLEVDLATRAAPGSELEVLARSAVRGDEASSVLLSFLALRAMPALGILIARGTLFQTSERVALRLLPEIEEARDVLLLPPGDPATEPYLPASTGLTTERDRLAATVADLRESLDQASQRVVDLQRQVVERTNDLQRTEQAAQGAAGTSSPRERQKIDELQAMIRSGNTERAELRRQLAEASAWGPDATDAPRNATSQPPVDETEAELELLPEMVERPLYFPRFLDVAKGALSSVPRNVANLAVRLTASLCAGEPAAWRGVKRAIGTRRPVLMARVGIHYRLLFCVEDDRLEVVDLVRRQGLQTTLKHLRA